MKTLLTLSLLALFATAHAQTITGRDEFIVSHPATLSGGTYFNLDSVPKYCWGQNDTVPTLTKQDRQALRLYSKLQWYDFSTYRFKGEGKRAVWISYAVAGILHGGREAYHAEPTVFEKRFNAAPQSFWGSQQSLRQYYDRDPDGVHKPDIFNSFRDYWHFAGATKNYIFISGAFTLGMSKQPIKYRVLDTVLGFAGFSLFANATYRILR